MGGGSILDVAPSSIEIGDIVLSESSGMLQLQGSNVATEVFVINETVAVSNDLQQQIITITNDQTNFSTDFITFSNETTQATNSMQIQINNLIDSTNAMSIQIDALIVSSNAQQVAIDGLVSSNHIKYTDSEASTADVAAHFQSLVDIQAGQKKLTMN